MLYRQATALTNDSVVVSLEDFPVFFPNDSYDVPSEIATYLERFFRRWPRHLNCMWRVPSIRQLKNIFFCKEDAIEAALRLLNQNGYDLHYVNLDSPILVMRLARHSIWNLQLQKIDQLYYQISKILSSRFRQGIHKVHPIGKLQAMDKSVG